jgi:protein-tyrosine phosphatase
MTSLVDYSARRIALPGTFNVRDLGGYPTQSGGTIRDGRLFRGDSLHRLDDVGREMLRQLGVRTVFDLRRASERDAYPSAVSGIRIVEVPIVEAESIAAMPSEDWQLLDIYLELLHNRGAAISGIAAQLTDDTLPALVHCMAGKDRTGVLVAVLLSALEVPDEYIVADFAASAALLSGEFRQETTSRLTEHGVPESVIVRILAAEPDHIASVLRVIDEEYGGGAQYLLEHGLTRDQLATLERELVAPKGEA